MKAQSIMSKLLISPKHNTVLLKLTLNLHKTTNLKDLKEGKVS